MAVLDPHTWYPIARSEEAPRRHVYQAQLFGYEFAVWRDDHGALNVWENRCPHRGLRLSLGVNNGKELRCQYHGWTYASQTGACTHVPAHPSLAEPTKACARPISTIEQAGFIWIALDPQTTQPGFTQAQADARLSLRSLPINRDMAAVREALASYRYAIPGRDGAMAASNDSSQAAPHVVELRNQPEASPGSAPAVLHFLLQPATEYKTIVHAVASGIDGDPLQIRKHHNRLMNALRAELESAAPPEAAQSCADPAIPLYKLLPVPRPAKQKFDCRIVGRRVESEGVISLELAAADPAHPLPALAAGAHLNLTTPSGLTRQYSIVNGPSERDTIIIGIKLEPDSRGGSRSMHEAATEGVVLQASVPRNTFPLVPSGKQPILIAGGIGITPLLSMAQALQAMDEPFELHYFVRAPEYVSFKARIEALGGAVHLHMGLDAAQTSAKLAGILAPRTLGQSKVYACGPGPMLDVVKRTALAGGIDDSDIHFEYFKNDAPPASGAPFTVRLERSGREFEVANGQTLLHALHEHGIELEASCEQGVCGTCFTNVIAGDIEHHDLYLSASEKASGKCIMPCVSRARSGTLILDL